ncbi:MAG: rRNA adenine N-6-methyltransferase family protein [Gemmataceae bacterium]
MDETLLFLGQMTRRMRVLGTAVPSGPVVARAMARAVGEIPENQVILELGPGTGSFTRELVRRFPNNRIIAIEFVEAFSKHLTKALPSVTVIHGCASELQSHLDAFQIRPGDVAAVVSGLPFLSLPKELTAKIMTSIETILQPGRRFVQITFSKRAWKRFELPGFVRESARRVWRNVPPAIVMTFMRKAES